MKIYFTASARGVKEFGQDYQAIYKKIQELGHQNLDDLVAKVDGDSFYSEPSQEKNKLHAQAMKNIQMADVVILEISLHSLSMGYVMHRALELGKPVIALYTAGNLPYFASTIENDKLQVIEYTKEDLGDVLQTALEYAQDTVDTRFNFFISPSLSHYLDWISSSKKIPRSVYLRQLIEDDRDKNRDQYESA